MIKERRAGTRATDDKHRPGTETSSVSDGRLVSCGNYLWGKAFTHIFYVIQAPGIVYNQSSRLGAGSMYSSCSPK